MTAPRHSGSEWERQQDEKKDTSSERKEKRESRMEKGFRYRSKQQVMVEG
jgi:hypothetical protein